MNSTFGKSGAALVRQEIDAMSFKTMGRRDLFVFKSISGIACWFNSLLARVAVLALLPVLTSCSSTWTYEFPSCDQSGSIQVLKVPKSYVDVSGDRLINETVPVGHAERVSFFRAYLFTTYPDFEPLATASEEKKKSTEAMMGAPQISSAWIIYGNGIDFYLRRDLYASSPDSPPAPPEESPDGKYWVYPDRNTRQGKPSYDGSIHFLPKETVHNVLIDCLDRGDNKLPTTGPRCVVMSLITDTPALSCITVGFRLPPQDLARWREFDERFKQRIKAMITTRQP